jgi:hypothetical protein
VVDHTIRAIGTPHDQIGDRERREARMTTVSAERLATIFVEVADTLVDEFDLLDFCTCSPNGRPASRMPLRTPS